MYVVYLAGGIASGKSTAARVMESLGACRIDLDVLSRTVLEPGGACLDEVRDAFGDDLIDVRTGRLDRRRLATVAFSTPGGIARLESIELPHIREALVAQLHQMALSGVCDVCVVEVPLLDRMGPLADLADEVVCVTCPFEVRRVRARERGVEEADFDRRAANQPSDEYLCDHADTVIENGGDQEELVAAVRAWWDGRLASGWSRMRGEGR